jgi:hypothetical protein
MNDTKHERALAGAYQRIENENNMYGLNYDSWDLPSTFFTQRMTHFLTNLCVCTAKAWFWWTHNIGVKQAFVVFSSLNAIFQLLIGLVMRDTWQRYLVTLVVRNYFIKLKRANSRR